MILELLSVLSNYKNTKENFLKRKINKRRPLLQQGFRILASSRFALGLSAMTPALKSGDLGLE